MERVASVLFLLIGIITLLVGCGSNKDKAALLDWLHLINEDNTDIFAKLSMEDIIQDKEPLESTSMGYGLLLTDREKEFDNQRLIQAVAPYEEFEINFKDKYWLIKNEELSNFILTFLESK